MDKETQAKVYQLIEDCHWRKEVHGVDICTGNCNVCMIEIERGRCPTLREYFSGQRDYIKVTAVEKKE